MRKTCRRLGFAILLTISTLEFSGCNSRSLVSTLRLPGKKDRSADVARKPSRAKEDRAAELLAEAREYERDGDFPNATRAYREYLNAGGEPINGSPEESPNALAEIDRQNRDRAASYESRRRDEDDAGEEEELADERSRFFPVRKAAKARTDRDDRSTSTRSVSPSIEDPWATSSDDAEPSPKTIAQVEDHQQLESSEESTAEDNELSRRSDKPAAVAATSKSSQTLPEDAIAEMMDLDEGAIDWGDETAEPEEVPQYAFNEAPSHEGWESIDDDAEDAVHSEHSDATSSEEWELVDTDDEQLDIPPADEAASADSELEPNLGSQSTFAAQCRNCDPWVYAQVMKLESSNPDVRTEGLSNLADMGTNARSASVAVRAMLEDSNPLVQANAAWTLWRVEEDATDSVNSLIPLLDHAEVEVIELACYILGDVGPDAEAAVPALERLQTYADGTTRIQASESLIRIRGADEKSVEVLTETLKSRDGSERWSAAIALGRCQGPCSPEAVAALTDALKDVDAEVRSAAALSLGAFGEEAIDATAELQRVAHSDEEQVRDAAIAALACMNAE